LGPYFLIYFEQEKIGIETLGGTKAARYTGEFVLFCSYWECCSRVNSPWGWKNAVQLL